MMRYPIIALAAVLIAGPAIAQRTIEQRMDRQEERMENGVEDGKLTPKEADKIEQRHENIEHKREQARADGHVTKREATRIRRAEDRAGKMIRENKHDAQKD